MLMQTAFKPPIPRYSILHKLLMDWLVCLSSFVIGECQSRRQNETLLQTYIQFVIRKYLINVSTICFISGLITCEVTFMSGERWDAGGMKRWLPSHRSLFKMVFVNSKPQDISNKKLEQFPDEN